jgi:hypothetical protein
MVFLLDAARQTPNPATSALDHNDSFAPRQFCPAIGSDG